MRGQPGRTFEYHTASYPCLREIDWTSDVFAKVPTQNPVATMKAIDS